MCDSSSSDKSEHLNNSVIHPSNNDKAEECETAEEAIISDSEEYLSESLR